MAFAVSKNLIEEVENKIFIESLFTLKSDITIDNIMIMKMLNFLHSTIRLILYPFRILQIGFSLFTTDLTKTIGVFLLLATPLILLIESPKLDPTIALLVFYGSLFFSILISVFSPPSSYCASGVEQEHIETITTLLHKKQISALEQLVPIRNNIQFFETRVQQKIVFLRGFLALMWTGFIYFITQHDFQPANPDKEVFISIGVSLLAILLLYIIIEAYSKTKALIFRSIQFGCNEYEYSLVK